MLADLRWLGLEWDEGPDKEGAVRSGREFLQKKISHCCVF